MPQKADEAEEINREANSLLSKSIVVETTQGAVEWKILTEHIQNVE